WRVSMMQSHGVSSGGGEAPPVVRSAGVGSTRFVADLFGPGDLDDAGLVDNDLYRAERRATNGNEDVALSFEALTRVGVRARVNGIIAVLHACHLLAWEHISSSWLERSVSCLRLYWSSTLDNAARVSFINSRTAQCSGSRQSRQGAYAVMLAHRTGAKG